MKSRLMVRDGVSRQSMLKILVLSLALALFLAACERPLQTIGEDEDGYPAPTVIVVEPGDEEPMDEEPTIEPTLPAPEETEAAPTEAAPTEMAPTQTPEGDESPRTDDGAEEPTAAPTEEAVPEATAEPTAEATAEPTAAATPTAAPEAGEVRVHVVQPGENLYRIGLQYGVSWTDLAEYNNIANPNDIEVGQQIRIPPADGSGEDPAATPAPQVTHVVQPGETLFIISQQYGVDWRAIAEANNVGAPYIIYAGDVLVIPGS